MCKQSIGVKCARTEPLTVNAIDGQSVSPITSSPGFSAPLPP